MHVPNSNLNDSHITTPIEIKTWDPPPLPGKQTYSCYPFPKKICLLEIVRDWSLQVCMHACILMGQDYGQIGFWLRVKIALLKDFK